LNSTIKSEPGCASVLVAKCRPGRKGGQWDKLHISVELVDWIKTTLISFLQYEYIPKRKPQQYLLVPFGYIFNHYFNFHK
jgi:hypothetical protein